MSRHRLAAAGALAVVLNVVGCGGRAARPTHAVAPATSPESDLARIRKSAVPTGTQDGDPRTGTGASAMPGPIDLDEIKISVIGRDAAGNPELETVAAMQLLREGTDAINAGKFEVALARLRQLVSEFPESKLAPVALWNMAVAQEKRGDTEAELVVLRELVARYPTSRESVDGHLYMGALLAHAKRWPEAERVLTDALTRSSLTWADRVEAGARLGYVALEQGALDRADAALRQAVDVWRKTPNIEDRYFAAMAYFYRGEVLYRRFAATPVRGAGVGEGGIQRQRADLLAREELATAAYDRWKEALELKQPYWATAAGYQMSQVFVEFWRATVTAPPPEDLAPAGLTAFRREVHERMRSHLEKALDGHEMNASLGKAFGVDTVWAKASGVRVAEIMAQLQREAGGEYVVGIPP